MQKITLEAAIEFAKFVVEKLPIKGWKFGAGDFNDNGTPDVVLEVYFKGVAAPWQVIVDLPALEVDKAFGQLAKILG